MYLQVLLFYILWSLSRLTHSFQLGKIEFSYNLTDAGINFKAVRENSEILSGTLNNGQNVVGIVCNEELQKCTINDYTLTIDEVEDGLHILWETQNLTNSFSDCFDFGDANWYGGPERMVQRWPIEKIEINGNYAYVLGKNDHLSVAERYWLNSKGAYIYLSEKVPLFVEQNVHIQGKVCFSARTDPPYVNRTRNILEYTVVFKDDPRDAHLHAINNYLGKPKGHPNNQMIVEPIWTTWAKYKYAISDEVVLNFAEEIRNQGYENGQIEIDDVWEVCYGAQEFSTVNFPNIKDTVARLKAQHFRVTLWVHPFVNIRCQNNSNEGLEKDYFVKNTYGTPYGAWWHGLAYQIDFTKPDAAEWFSNRLRKLQEEIGIDSFKFDAGETGWAPQPAIYKNVDSELIPNILSESYVRTCAEFGDLIEVRSPYRTQDLPIFVRMIDKDSVWGDNNGLYSLLTTLLQMNMNGYPMVLPDMIGGNGYNGQTPDAELLVRWTQANTFMPAMQFSYLPWEIVSDEFDTAAIVKKFIELHVNVSAEILDAMYMSINYGWPVNPPVWWIDPTNTMALACDDEFLVGDSILIAPVIEQGATARDVFLPSGRWIDGNNGTIYEGPILLDKYPAPIEVLPYFFRDK